MGDAEKEGAKKKKTKETGVDGNVNECVCVRAHTCLCVNGGSVFWVVTMIRRF